MHAFWHILPHCVSSIGLVRKVVHQKDAMKAEAQSGATLKELSHDPVQEGFEELENYLRSTPRSVASRHA